MTIPELIKGCVEARKPAQDMLYQRYAPKLYGLCLRYCNCAEDAQDVLQEGLIKVYQHIHKTDIKEENVFYAWMKRIIINTALNFLRDNKKFSFVENQSHIPEENFYSDDLNKEGDMGIYENLPTNELLAMIKELPIGYRTVFNLYAIENFTHNEIAAELKISVNTSKSQLFKSRRMLAQRIKQEIENRKIKIVI